MIGYCTRCNCELVVIESSQTIICPVCDQQVCTVEEFKRKAAEIAIANMRQELQDRFSR